MKRQILFIQGGGEGAYDIDGKLAAHLQNALGKDYEIIYPEMPNESDPDYELWKKKIRKELSRLGDELILMGHSLGSSFLLKYITEEKIEKTVHGIFLLATPYWGGDGWKYEGYEKVTLTEDFASKLPKEAPVFFYHNKNDEIIPFIHLSLYAEKVPWANIHASGEGGHQFEKNISEVAADVKSPAFRHGGPSATVACPPSTVKIVINI